MGVHIHGGTMSGALTPICEDCAVSLCWDIDRTTYLEAKAFWDAWKCQDCAGTRLSAFRWKTENGHDALPESIRAVCDQFAEDHAHLDDAGCAVPTIEVCRLFVEALRTIGCEAGIRAIDVPLRAAHYVVDVDAMTIDWCAARQDEAAPFPLTFRTKLGWPIVPPTREELLADLSLLSSQEMDDLVASVVARRRAA